LTCHHKFTQCVQVTCLQHCEILTFTNQFLPKIAFSISLFVCLGPLNTMSHARLSVYVPTVLKVEGDSGAVVSVDKIDIHKSST